MGHLRKLARYATVSVVSTTVSLSILGTLVATSLVTVGWANVIATAAGTVPSFELNRRWVWRRTGRRSLAAEVVPFCALSFLGLALSTLAVSFGAARAASLGTAARHARRAGRQRGHLCDVVGGAVSDPGPGPVRRPGLVRRDAARPRRRGTSGVNRNGAAGSAPMSSRGRSEP